MRLEARKYLFDIQRAAERIARFTEGKRFSDYERDEMLRSAVERQFEIIGEALGQLARIELQTAERISEYRTIIDFRNFLIHGYAEVDNQIVWGTVERRLARLRREVQELAAEYSD